MFSGRSFEVSSGGVLEEGPGMVVGGVPGSIIIHSSLGTIHDDVIPSDKS